LPSRVSQSSGATDKLSPPGEDELATLRRSLLKGLGAAAKSLDNPCGLSFHGAESALQTLQIARDDGDLQSVLIDSLGQPDGESAWQAEDLVQALHALRPELDLYVLVDSARDEETVGALTREAIDGFFMRDEADPRGWFRILQAEIQEKSRTPFFDALREYVLMAKDAWHTPGHSSGDSLRGSPWSSSFHEFLGDNLLRADLSVKLVVKAFFGALDELVTSWILGKKDYHLAQLAGPVVDLFLRGAAAPKAARRERPALALATGGGQ